MPEVFFLAGYSVYFSTLIHGFDEVVDAWKRLFGEDIHFDR